jgi:hypothetical protein
MSGYVGRTQPDSSTSANKTTIYLSPEEGAAAWCVLVVHRYEQIFHLISHGTGNSINVRRLAKTYGFGGPDKPDGSLTAEEKAVVNHYLAGWKKWSLQPPRPVVLEPTTEIDPRNDDHLLSLAAGMFSHEASIRTPLVDTQIQRGIEAGRAQFPTLVIADLKAELQSEIEASQERLQSVLRRLQGSEVD